MFSIIVFFFFLFCFVHLQLPPNKHSRIDWKKKKLRKIPYCITLMINSRQCTRTFHVHIHLVAIIVIVYKIQPDVQFLKTAIPGRKKKKNSSMKKLSPPCELIHHWLLQQVYNLSNVIPAFLYRYFTKVCIESTRS